uniref:Uncharacterized protein n=1 Tax=Cacopsylla melanoneura TaxID=428564 RepID=A0A8D8QNF7_9HEMI
MTYFNFYFIFMYLYLPTFKNKTCPFFLFMYLLPKKNKNGFISYWFTKSSSVCVCEEKINKKITEIQCFYQGGTICVCIQKERKFELKKIQHALTIIKDNKKELLSCFSARREKEIKK